MHTAAHPAAGWSVHWSMFLATMTAIMRWQVPMPMAPMVRTGLRPTRSIHRTEGIVARSITMPTTPVARSEVVLPLRPSFWKMKGA